MKRTSLLLAVVLLLLTIPACDKDDNPLASGAVGTYVGTFLSPSDTSAGLVVLTVASSGSASGYARMYDDTLITVTFSGTLSNTTLTATATDGTQIAGTLSDSTITGTADGSTFSVRAVTSGAVLQTYYGTYSSTTGPPESGQLIVCTVAATLWGVVIQPDGQVGEYLVGTISGDAASIHSAFDPATEIAAGSRSGNTWSGTYTGDQGGGTWTVTLVP